jgi:hypothetical protein
MAIPLHTTTISILRSGQDGTQDDYDGVTYSTVVSGVRAVIGSLSGSENVSGGSSEQMGAHFDCDPCDLRHDDRVLDEQTSETWQVSWVRRRIGLGLDHMVGDLLAVTDRVST